MQSEIIENPGPGLHANGYMDAEHRHFLLSKQLFVHILLVFLMFYSLTDLKGVLKHLQANYMG